MIKRAIRLSAIACMGMMLTACGGGSGSSSGNPKQVDMDSPAGAAVIGMSGMQLAKMGADMAKSEAEKQDEDYGDSSYAVSGMSGQQSYAPENTGQCNGGGSLTSGASGSESVFGTPVTTEVITATDCRSKHAVDGQLMARLHSRTEVGVDQTASYMFVKLTGPDGTGKSVSEFYLGEPFSMEAEALLKACENCTG